MWLAGLLVSWYLHEEGISEAPSRWAAYCPPLIPLPIMWKFLFPKVASERPPAEGPRNTGLGSMNGFEIWNLEFGALRSMLEIKLMFTWTGATIGFCLRKRRGDRAGNYFFQQEHGMFGCLDIWVHGIYVIHKKMYGWCMPHTLNWLSPTPWFEVVWHLILLKWRTSYMFYRMYFYKSSLARYSREIHPLPRACFTGLIIPVTHRFERHGMCIA